MFFQRKVCVNFSKSKLIVLFSYSIINLTCLKSALVALIE